MDAPLVIERDVHTGLAADELWRLVATSAGWREWLVDEASVDISPGEGGEVVEDGVRRHVGIDTVEHGRHISFVWGEPGGEVSRVSLRLVEEADGRVALRIREEWPAAACADCPLRTAGRWELRACLLCIAASATCRV
jgi:uncharacterized protein YndB with AHSA1/START domain